MHAQRLKNYPDPLLVVKRHSADALRMYLISSPVVKAEKLRFDEKDVMATANKILYPWYVAASIPSFLGSDEFLD